MATPPRRPGTVSKIFSRSKVAPVDRQELKNRHKHQKRDPHGQNQNQGKKEPASKKQDAATISKGPSSHKSGSESPSRENDTDRADKRQGNLINIRISQGMGRWGNDVQNSA